MGWCATGPSQIQVLPSLLSDVMIRMVIEGAFAFRGAEEVLIGSVLAEEACFLGVDITLTNQILSHAG